jgi:hypothetical protein
MKNATSVNCVWIKSIFKAWEAYFNAWSIYVTTFFAVLGMIKNTEA